MKNKRKFLFLLSFFLLFGILSGACQDGDDDDNDNNDNDNDDDNDDYTITEGFVFISAGQFTMGSDVDYHGTDNETLHQVILTHGFEMMITETTQEQFESLMHFNPSYNDLCQDDCPVESVSWYDALAFANMLSIQHGFRPCFVFSDVECRDDGIDNDSNCADGGGIARASIALDSALTVYDCEGYRLPTEAEWEYAIRAGTETDFYNGDLTEFECYYLDPVLDEIAWYCGNADDFTRVVGRKLPNAWDLYDMSGNVKEWVWDSYEENLTDATNPWGGVPGQTDLVVLKGGSFLSGSRNCRSASRGKTLPSGYRVSTGFRLVRTLN